jgi:hydrogenase maturation protease
MDFWTDMSRAAPARVVVDGVEIGRGSRVRLRPGPHADAMDALLAGRAAVVEGIDQDETDAVRLAVTLEDDPGRDLGDARLPGHRFFFAPGEVEPLPRGRRILVAGIGNVFLGDDGFGVAVAHRFAARPLPPGVAVVDFGIRGLDLAYALQDDWEAVVLVDAAPRGGAPGTLHVIDGAPDAAAGADLATHGMDPVRVLALARRLGRVPARVLVVGCEPGAAGETDDGVAAEPSPPVRAAIEEAVRLVEGLVHEISSTDASPGKVELP